VQSIFLLHAYHLQGNCVNVQTTLIVTR
jgi:hypothetical protein